MLLRPAPDDPALVPYHSVRDRDLTRHDLFLLEGRILLDLALTAHTPLRSILLSERAARSLAADLLPRVPPSTPIYVLPDDALEALIGFDLHRGILAAAPRPAPCSAHALLQTLPPPPAPCTLLVLEGLTNHDNVGACFRNAAALGAHALLLDARCCDPLYRKALRVSAGHALTLPFSHADTTPALLDALDHHGFATAALSLHPDALPLTPHTPRPHPRLALLLGAEGQGLSPHTLARVHHHLRIPMPPHVDSLNVATAAALALFALALPPAA